MIVSPPGDPDGHVAAVWLAREVLSEVCTARDLTQAKRRLIVFFEHAVDDDVPSLTRLAHKLDGWRDEILAFHHRRRAPRTDRSGQPAD